MGQSRKDNTPRFGLPNANVYTSSVDEDKIETGINTSDEFVTILKLDVRGYRKLIIEAYNDDIVSSIDWRIKASRKSRTAVALSEMFWDATSMDFREIKAEELVESNTYGTDFTSDLENYSFISIQAKSSTSGRNGIVIIRASLVP